MQPTLLTSKSCLDIIITHPSALSPFQSFLALHPPSIPQRPLIIIENLIAILYHCLHHPNLPACILNTPPGPRTHQRRAPHDRQITRIHSVHRCIFHDSVQMQRHGTQRRVIRVRQGIDDGVQRVAAQYVIVDLGGVNEGGVVLRG